MKALLVVDMQKGLCEKGGTLYFKDCEKIKNFIMKKINRYLNKNRPVIFTLDTHKKNDEEFKRLPEHCVSGTEETELIDEIQELIKKQKRVYFIKKSRNSAFYNTDFDKLIKKLKIKEFDIVGVCTDICVLHTAAALADRDIKFTVWKNGTASFDRKNHKFALDHIKVILGGIIK